MDLKYYNGFKVVIIPDIVKDYIQRRKHRKKRINKKWIKRYGYRPVYDIEHCYVLGNTIYMVKAMYEELNKISCWRKYEN